MMQQEKVFRFLLMAAATAVILVVVQMANFIVAPILLALFFAIVLLVPIDWLQKKGCPRLISLLIVISLTAVIFFGIGRLVVASLNDLIRQFPIYKDKIIEKTNTLDKKLEGWGFVLSNRATEPEKKELVPEIPEQATTEQNGPDSKAPDPKPEPQKIEETKEKFLIQRLLSSEDPDGAERSLEDEEIEEGEEEEEEKREEVFVYPTFFDQGGKQQLTELNTEMVMYWVGRVVLELRNLAASSFLVLVITLFMISEATRFPAKVDWAFGKTGPISNVQLHHIAREIRRYLFIKSISCIFSAVAATTIYFCFDVRGALFWGVVAFFLYFIPNFGGIMASIIPGLLVFMAWDIQGLLLYIIVLASVESMLGYVVEPKMLGHGLGISTVVIILSLLIWGWILGPVGLFLAAPLTIMIKIILQAFEETEWIAILLGDKCQPSEQNR